MSEESSMSDLPSEQVSQEIVQQEEEVVSQKEEIVQQQEEVVSAKSEPDVQPVEKMSDADTVVDNEVVATTVSESPATSTSTPPSTTPSTTPSTASGNKWSSTFSTANPVRPSSLSTSTNTTPASTSSTFAIGASATKPLYHTLPTKTTTTSTSTSTSTPTTTTTTNSNVSSFIQQRSAAWGGGQPLNSTKTNDKPQSYSTMPAGTFAYSSTPKVQSQSASHSAYSKSSGVAPGSLASFVGQSLNVKHTGQFTGLVKNRVDKDEEKARVEHANRGVNKDLAKVLADAVTRARSTSADSQESQSIKYLAKKLEENK